MTGTFDLWFSQASYEFRLENMNDGWPCVWHMADDPTKVVTHIIKRKKADTQQKPNSTFWKDLVYVGTIDGEELSSKLERHNV